MLVTLINCKYSTNPSVKLPNQPVFAAFFQGIKPYVLDRDTLLAGGAKLTPPLGLTDMTPVGRSITSTCVAVFFDKGFQQQRTKAIAMLPVLRQLSSR